MGEWLGKNIVVIGGSGDVGRRFVEIGVREGARVLAAARRREGLQRLAKQTPGVETVAIDAADDDAPEKIFGRLNPDVLVLCGGALPPAAPIQEQSWRDFAVNWEADVKMTFQFCKAALNRPLAPGSLVLVVSSGAALAGSPISGGYAGAKRTQMFIANYSQKEADRQKLGLRFVTFAPRIVADTDLGRHAIAGYSRYLGVSEADFAQSMATPPNAADVAGAIMALATHPGRFKENLYVVSGTGLEAVS